MKIRIFLSLAIGAAGVLAAAPVALRLKPEATSPAVATIDSADPALAAAQDAQGGWKQVSHNGPFSGYVREADIGKDLLPTEGSAVRLVPSEDGPQLTTIAPEDKVTVVADGSWFEVQVAKALPVYFQPAAAAPLAVAPAAALAETAAAAEPAATVAPAAPAPAAVSKLPQVPQEVTAQEFTGILRKSKRGLGLSAPDYPYEIVTPEGKRIAWVDMRVSMPIGTFENYLGRSVVLYGPWRRVYKQSDIVVFAQTIRIQ